MLRGTSRSLRGLIASRVALVVLMVLLSYSSVYADDVNLNVEVLAAPSVTKNDFNFSTPSPTQSPSGRVLGTTSARTNKTKFKIIYLLLLINPLLLI